MIYKEEVKKEVSNLPELEAPTNRFRSGKLKARRIGKVIECVEEPNAEGNRSCVQKPKLNRNCER
ncbi:6842_t:CDS:1, partial [Cetraspora pellucida]